MALFATKKPTERAAIVALAVACFGGIGVLAYNGYKPFHATDELCGGWKCAPYHSSWDEPRAKPRVIYLHDAAEPRTHRDDPASARYEYQRERDDRRSWNFTH